MTDAVHDGDVDAVRDGVPALDGAPGVALGVAVLRLLLRMPADRGRVEEHDRALQGGEARALRVPLVPADERSDPALLRVEGAEAEVARREVELLVEGGVVRDVHLAVGADDLAGGVDDGGAVVIEAGRAPLEDRRHHDDARLAGRVLLLAEVGRAVELGQADDLGPGGGGGGYSRGRLAQVLGGLARHRHLDEPDADRAALGHRSQSTPESDA